MRRSVDDRWRLDHRKGRPTKVARDPELQAYTDELLKTVPARFTDLAGVLASRFGAIRAPSKSALHRYWLRHRDRLIAERDQPRP